MNANYVNYLRATKKSENTIKNYTKYVSQMLVFINKPESEISFDDLINWQASIAHLSANTVCLQIASVKSYFDYLYKAEIVSKNIAEGLGRPKVNPKAKPYLEAEDVRKLIEASRTIRDKAILLTFCTTGLRISELVDLTREDFEQAKTTREIIITGKGNKQRSVFLNDEVIEVINKYLKTRIDDSEHLFVTFKNTKLNEESFSRTIKATAKRAGLPYWEDMTNHTLRAVAATRYAEAGVPIEDIRDMLGHSNVAVTSIYLKSCKNNIRSAMMQKIF